MWFPPWDSLHPLVVHFPIALLAVAPLFAVLALLFPSSARVLGISALILMALGTLGTYVAFSTGKAAEDHAEVSEQAEVILESHEELAEITRIVFTVLSFIYAVIVLLPRVLKRDLPRVPSTVVGVAFLLLYMGGGVLLANVGHQGARLVHQYGVHAPMTDAPLPVPIALDLEGHTDDE